MDEKKIIKKCQSGDKEDFARLYDAYFSNIFRFIYYKTGQKETAEDLTSKTFFKALKNVGQFDPEGNFSAWLYRIARNNVIDYYRLERNMLDIDDCWDLDDRTDLLADLDNKIKLDKVKDLLKNLSTEQRELIFLRVWQGLSFKEIAGICGKSEAACKMSFSRSVGKLRDNFPLLILLSLLFKNL